LDDIFCKLDLTNFFVPKSLLTPAYKCEKQRLELENFSGLSPRAVLQDSVAKFFTRNLTVIYAWEAC